MSHALALSPSGQLFVVPDEQAEPKLGLTDATGLIEAFAASSARGLELLASAFLHDPLPLTFAFWRELARRYFTALCHNPNLETAAELGVPAPRLEEWPPWRRGRHP